MSHNGKSKKTKFSNGELLKVIMIGGFPGYIWGWFQVPDYEGYDGWNHLPSTYSYPIVSMLLSLGLYLLIKQLIKKKLHSNLSSCFAASAISVYYWYRLPALIGFGIYKGDGMLTDLSQNLSSWFPSVLQVLSTLFFFWWMVFYMKKTTSWLIRPPFSQDLQTSSKQFKKVEYSFVKNRQQSF